MRYTQGQTRELLGIPEQTFRHWRNVIPALRRLSGKGARFSPGHLLAIAVLVELDHAYELRISRIAEGADQLFSLAADRSWPALEQMVVILTPFTATLRRGDQPAAPVGTLSLMIACAPLIRDLRQKLLGLPDAEAQGSLHFSPHDLQGRVR